MAPWSGRIIRGTSLSEIDEALPRLIPSNHSALTHVPPFDPHRASSALLRRSMTNCAQVILARETIVMRQLVSIITAGLLALAAGATLGGEKMEAKGKKVEFKVHSGY